MGVVVGLGLVLLFLFEEGDGHVGILVRQERAVGDRHHAEEIADPEARVRAGAVEGEDVVALAREVVEDQAALVDFFRVDPLLGVQFEVAIAGGNAEERDHALGF